MNAEWPNTSLDEIADLQTGFPFASDRYSDDSKDIRLLRGDGYRAGENEVGWRKALGHKRQTILGSSTCSSQGTSFSRWIANGLRRV